MATLNLKNPILVRFKNLDEAKQHGCDKQEVQFKAGFHAVPDELMEHPYVKAHHVVTRSAATVAVDRAAAAKKAAEDQAANHQRNIQEQERLRVQAEAEQKAKDDKAAAEEAARVAAEEAAAKKAAEDAANGGGGNPAKPLDELSYSELKEKFAQVKGEPAPNNIKKADLIAAIQAAAKQA